MDSHTKPTNRTLPESSSSTISGSGSFQSHLSTTNSQQRLRATNSYAVPTKECTISSTSPVLSNPSSLTAALRALSPFPDMQISMQFQEHHSSSRSWNGLAFKWMAFVYCFLSFIFTTTALYKYLYLANTFHRPVKNELVSSPLGFLSTEQRLGRISPYLGRSQLDPYLLLGSPPADDMITACLWTTDGEDSLHSVVSWATRWTGPISLVMTTTQEPRSMAHQKLLERLTALKGHPPLSALSLHLVHVMNEQFPPSAYLNLARLFANSPTVLLFPANLSNVLSSNFYEALNSHIHHPVRKPVLVTNTITSAFSIPGLTPVILPQNYQLWCTERAFLASRASEWDDCLWQLWLEEYGLGNTNITIPLDTEDPVADAIGLTRLRNRLSGRYRVETCELAIKRLSTDTPRMSKSGKRRLQWVKNFCRQTENAMKNSGA
ncbi:hypothetical protein DFH07DRAFT_953966 [Mycena maculata]|uniref:Uncharacterized protein n=1 Tax=Mycena maculata TaxID=230809 RepID=A0AAD7NPJ6_9AGAR|nr:hypothetical protein DFH07DRAFT_953966 [Mycena maculata]